MKLKRLSTLACLLLIALTGMAQEVIYPQRGHIINTTEYPTVSASPTNRVGSRTSAPLPATGSPTVPVILVQFPDLKFSVKETDEEVLEYYEKFCNGSGIEGKRYSISGGIYGAVSDYFIEQSDSLFKPKFQVIGPITLSKSYAYYGEQDPKNKDTHDMHITEFFKEACDMAINNYDGNWSNFDNNDDNKVDFVFFIYAGLGQNDSNNDDANTIWPHEQASQKTIGDVTFGGYGCTCELVRIAYKSSSGDVTYEDQPDGIGLMCHELSHGLGLPDLYDYNGKEFGMDYWDLMDSGDNQMMGNQPCGYSAYERDFMGWRELKKVAKDEAVTLTLEPLETGGCGYVITNDGQPSGNEYFILENRQSIGFDMCLGCTNASVRTNYGTCHGLLITHIDYNASSWAINRLNSSTHQRVTPVPADGELIAWTKDGLTAEYYKSLRGDLYPGNQNVTEISSYNVYTGTFTQTITDIVEHEDGTITVNINGGDPNAISDVTTNKASANRFFSLSGQEQKGLQKGVNIVKYADGTTKKVMKKN